MLDALPLAAAGRVLDIGTGPGTMIPELARRAPAARVFGIDASEGAVARAKADTGAPVATASSLALPFAAGSVDAALFSFSLFHLPSPDAGLREAARVLRDGAALGIVTHDAGLPNATSRARAIVMDMTEELPGLSPAPCWLCEATTPGGVGELLEANGFTPARIWRGSSDEEHDREGRELLARARSRVPDIPADEWSSFEQRVHAALADLGPDDFRFTYGFVYAVATAVETRGL